MHIGQIICALRQEKRLTLEFVRMLVRLQKVDE
jgi:hypothetical protein